MTFHFWLSCDPDRAVQAGHRALTVAHAQADFNLQVVANLCF
jgi:hypothetical protein